MKKLLEEAKKLQNILVDNRRYLHENAETHIDLPVTKAYVLEKLKEMGYEPKEICKSGVVAVAGGKKPGKTFLLRADMDALPITEDTDIAFKSKTNNMHACGHDLHTAMLLGAAQLLKNHEDEIDGQVKLMFQPAEETLAGARNMLDAGVLENPKVDAAMMIHVSTGMPIPAGSVFIPNAGIASSASDWFTINVQGKGGHGAMPNDTIDPLNVISHIHVALQAVNARELKPGENAVLTIGQMHGGNTSNVIPDTAFLSGTIRTFSKEAREFIKKRLEEISSGIASTFRATSQVEYPCGCPCLINNKELREQLKQYASELIGEEKIIKDGKGPDKLLGSEDFAYISEQVPSVMFGLGAGSSLQGFTYPQHHPKAVFDESPLYIGSALYANNAMEWLKNNK